MYVIFQVVSIIITLLFNFCDKKKSSQGCVDKTLKKDLINSLAEHTRRTRVQTLAYASILPELDLGIAA